MAEVFVIFALKKFLLVTIIKPGIGWMYFTTTQSLVKEV